MHNLTKLALCSALVSMVLGCSDAKAPTSPQSVRSAHVVAPQRDSADSSEGGDSNSDNSVTADQSNSDTGSPGTVTDGGTSPGSAGSASTAAPASTPPATVSTSSDPQATVTTTTVSPQTDSSATGTLTITGLKNNYGNDLSVQVTAANGQVSTVEWPAEGAVVQLAGACQGNPAKISIKTMRHDETFDPSNPECFVGSPGQAGQLNIGFEHDCNSLDIDHIDDAIATFSCSATLAPTVTSLRIVSGIDLNDWIN